MLSREDPLNGRCACGAVRFEVTTPFDSAGYCHCHRCQRRSGVPWTFNGLVEAGGFEVTAGPIRLGPGFPRAAGAASPSVASAGATCTVATSTAIC